MTKNQFQGPWHKDKYKNFLINIRQSPEIRHEWNQLMCSIKMDKFEEDHVSLLGQVMKAFGRCHCNAYLKAEGFGYNIDECNATRQRLKYKGYVNSNTSMKRSSDGHISLMNRCFNCGETDHFIKDCPLPRQRGVNCPKVSYSWSSGYQ